MATVDTGALGPRSPAREIAVDSRRRVRPLFAAAVSVHRRQNPHELCWRACVFHAAHNRRGVHICRRFSAVGSTDHFDWFMDYFVQHDRSLQQHYSFNDVTMQCDIMESCEEYAPAYSANFSGSWSCQARFRLETRHVEGCVERPGVPSSDSASCSLHRYRHWQCERVYCCLCDRVKRLGQE